jgi:hypothetical protein
MAAPSERDSPQQIAAVTQEILDSVVPPVNQKAGGLAKDVPLACAEYGELLLFTRII